MGSEQISEQSMTLLRGLSLIGLVIAVLTLWSSALEMTSWLDKVVVWQVSEVVSGSSTLVDVTLQSLIYALITLLVTFVGVRNLPGILELLILRRLELSPGTGYAVTTLLRYLILMTGVLSAFAILGFQWSRLQWLVAAFGVGLGFGLQEIFANFISGLILLFERPIRIGDIVTINDLSGTVSKIQTRATTIIDWDNKEIVVPNKTFITEKLINWSLTDSITRIVIPIGVAYGSDVEKVEELLYQVAEEHPLVLNDPSPSVFFLAFGASSWISSCVYTLTPSITAYRPFTSSTKTSINCSKRTTSKSPSHRWMCTFATGHRMVRKAKSANCTARINSVS